MVTIPKSIYCVAYLHMATFQPESCLRDTSSKMHPEFAKQICAFCAISFSTSFTAFLRLTPDSLHLWIAQLFEATRCSGTACKLFTQVALSLHVSCDMVEFAIAAASFTLIADECLYNKCHTQATRDCRKAFRMHTPWPRIYGKSRRHSTPHGSIFDIKRRPPKPIRVDI
jgi:hypothetical protein